MRGYIIGSGWKDYQKTGTVCGIKLPAGLKEAREAAASRCSRRRPRRRRASTTKTFRSPKPKSSSAPRWRRKCATCRSGSTAKRRSMRRRAASSSPTPSSSSASTRRASCYLIDEILTPDSSRFWPAAEYRIGISPPSFDKQIVRDWLETTSLEQEAAGAEAAAGGAREDLGQVPRSAHIAEPVSAGRTS